MGGSGRAEQCPRRLAGVVDDQCPRMGQRRLTRLTNAYSKKAENLRAAMGELSCRQPHTGARYPLREGGEDQRSTVEREPPLTGITTATIFPLLTA